MNPSSGRASQPIGTSNQNSRRMTSSNRFHPYSYTTADEKINIPGQSLGGRFPQSSCASPCNTLPSSASPAQSRAPQRLNMPLGNYQNPHPGPAPALPRSAGYSWPATHNYQNPMSGRTGVTPMGMPGPNYAAVPQERSFPSQQWQQQALPLPSASQMMPCAGGDAIIPSPNKQGKARFNKGNPLRSQGLRVLSGRVGKVIFSA